MVLIHCEAKAQDALAGLIKEKFKLESFIPSYLEELEITAGMEPVPHMVVGAVAEVAHPKVDWDLITVDTEHKWLLLKAKLAELHARPWAEQTELRDRMLKLNFELMRFLTEL